MTRKMRLRRRCPPKSLSSSQSWGASAFLHRTRAGNSQSGAAFSLGHRRSENGANSLTGLGYASVHRPAACFRWRSSPDRDRCRRSDRRSHQRAAEQERGGKQGEPSATLGRAPAHLCGRALSSPPLRMEVVDVVVGVAGRPPPPTRATPYCSCHRLRSTEHGPRGRICSASARLQGLPPAAMGDFPGAHHINSDDCQLVGLVSPVVSRPR